MVKTGLDILAAGGFAPLRGKCFGVLCHQASVNRDGVHIIDLMAQSGILPDIIFAPEHGLFPVAQDQQDVAHWRHPKYKIPVHSLYGAKFESLYPPPDIMRRLDVVLVDLFDVGARYYTFVWTAAMMLKVAAKTDTKIIIADRPNPIRGDVVEGPVQEEGFLSFVGLYPLPIRHGLTIAEILGYVNRFYEIGADVEVVKLSGWRRDMWFDETGLLWVMPSPNMPSLTTAIVYPGMCLFEGTNVSEGRGTTRPFEIFGAPFVDPYQLTEFAAGFGIPGALLRPMYFVPTFNKYAGQLCAGAQIHITDRDGFRPVWTALVLLHSLIALYPRRFEFKAPPYEFEAQKLPIDILFGSDRWRKMLLAGADPREIYEMMSQQSEEFQREIREFYLY